jgi:hypothetical protein
MAGAADERHDDGQARQREARVDQEGDMDPTGELRTGGHDRGVDPEDDRAAGDLAQVDDPAGETRPPPT